MSGVTSDGRISDGPAVGAALFISLFEFCDALEDRDDELCEISGEAARDAKGVRVNAVASRPI